MAHVLIFRVDNGFLEHVSSQAKNAWPKITRGQEESSEAVDKVDGLD